MKITIITVVYNADTTIEDAVRSVKSQVGVDIEHIVIDGGSSDETLSILNRYRDSIDVLVSEPDESIYDAMNKGIALSSGDVIGFLNSDDVFNDEKVLSRVGEAFTDSSIDACYGDLNYVRSSCMSRVVRYWKSCDFEPGMFSRGWCPPHPTFYVRKEVYDKYGLFDLKYSIGNDVELMMRFMEKYKIKTRYIPGVMVMMRLGGESNKNILNIIHQNREIIRAARDNEIKISVGMFMLYKLFSRFLQVVRRP